MARILFPLYYRQFGVRRLANLLSPTYVNIDSLPRNSMLHYISNDEDFPDPPIEAEYLKGFAKKIAMFYPGAMASELGNPTRNAKQLNLIVKPFHIANNKKFRRCLTEEMIEKDPLSLTIFNYSYLAQLYRYPPSPMAQYHKWKNIQTTVWKTISEQAQKSDKNHFIFMGIPKDLPARGFLNIFAKRENLQMLRVFNTKEKLFLLDVWRWISPDTRDKSIMGAVTPEAASRINIVFEVKPGQNVLINLAYLASWIKGNENFTDFKSAQQMPSEQIRMLVLKFFLNMESWARSNDIASEVDVNEVEGSESKDVDTDLSEVEATGDDSSDEVQQTQSVIETKDTTGQPKLTKVEDLGDGEFEELDLASEFKKLEKELAFLDRISERKMARHGVVIKNNDIPDEPIEETPKAPEIPPEEIETMVLTPKSPEQALKDKIENNLEIGNFTGAEYKKLLEDTKKLETLEDPFGSKKKLVEAAIIKPEDLVIDKEDTKIENVEGVEDQSIKESSLLGYDKKYLKTLKNKDILNAITSFQRAGVIIRKVEAEKHTSVLGSYTDLAIELRPINGKPGTVHVRLPEIGDDGCYTASGSKYFMRKQIVD